jgi:hypothetical protein
VDRPLPRWSAAGHHRKCDGGQPHDGNEGEQDQPAVRRKPVELGCKPQVVDDRDGIVLDHTVMMGDPADGPLLVSAVDGRG